jgi:ATP-dependent DNA helicase RecG
MPAIESVTISDEQAVIVTEVTEDHFRDKKSRRISPSTFSKTISAFANADGGEVYLGIEDDGTWAGFAIQEAANAHIGVLDGLFPLGSGYHAAFLENENLPGVVAHIQVLKSPSIVVGTDGLPRVRRGAQNLKIDTPEKLATLERNKGITSHETSTVSASTELISNSATIIEFILGVVPSAEPEPWLRMQQMIRDDLPTVGGLLLYADLPQATLPKSGIKLYRYRTSGDVGTRETLDFDPLTIEGPLYTLISDAVTKTSDLVSNIQV